MPHYVAEKPSRIAVCRVQIEFHRNETIRSQSLATNSHLWFGPTRVSRPALLRYWSSWCGRAGRACDRDRCRKGEHREIGAKSRARSRISSDDMGSENET